MRVLPMRTGAERYRPRIPRPLRTAQPALASRDAAPSQPKGPIPPPLPLSAPTHTDIGFTPETLSQGRHLLDVILSEAQATDRVLDFGAGKGDFAMALRQLHLDVTAVEPDASLADVLASRGMCASCSAAALPVSSFDLIYSFNALERIGDDAEALRQLHACLRPEGRLLLYVPAFMLLYGRSDAQAGCLRRYTRRGLQTAVSAAGFHVERVTYTDSLGFFAALLVKLFGRSASDEPGKARKIYDRLVFPVSVWLDVLTRRCFGRYLLLIAGRR